jgi:hypothetical protein
LGWKNNEKMRLTGIAFLRENAASSLKARQSILLWEVAHMKNWSELTQEKKADLEQRHLRGEFDRRR